MATLGHSRGHTRDTLISRCCFNRLSLAHPLLRVGAMNTSKLIVPFLCASLLGAAACSFEEEPEEDIGQSEQDLSLKYDFDFKVKLYGPKPFLTSFTPESARPGESVTITGNNFNRDVKGNYYLCWQGAPCAPPWQLYLGSRSVAFDVVSRTQLRFVVPTGQSGGKLSIRKNGSVVSQTGAAFFTAPSSLVSVTHSASQINLSWSDNANDETAYEVWWTNPGWVRLGTIGANNQSEPITGLPANNTRQYKVRAVRNGQFSEFSNAVIGTTSTTTPPTVVISNNLLSPLLNGVATIATDANGQPLVFGILDTNGDGVLSGEPTTAPGNSASLYPRWRGNACGVEEGARLAPGTNVVLVAQIETWSSVARPQFVAIHAAFNEFNGVATMATMTAGDLNPSGTAEVLGASQPPSFNMSIVNGHASGWVTGNVFASGCIDNLVTGATVQFQFDQIPVYNE